MVNEVYKILHQINDPEVPVLTIMDLGIVRDVKANNEKIDIFITPTYMACPAMDAITIDIKMKMIENGYTNVAVHQVLEPAWTTDWMTQEGKEKLKQYGIAPPYHSKDEDRQIHCPQCNSADTKLLSQFGSTACKALYQCQECKEPFDFFKCH
jgi:ring-1,2-phenylacetyl-CoA epoxidase subunit PaaD